jgi:uncharacterized protein DUF4158
MPRRELLTPTERVQLFAFPEDEGELIRLATLARADLTYIRQHRGDHNRLGLAIQMVYLRHPSRVLPQSEAPYPPLLGIVAAQLKVTPAPGRSTRSAMRLGASTFRSYSTGSSCGSLIVVITGR